MIFLSKCQIKATQTRALSAVEPRALSVVEVQMSETGFIELKDLFDFKIKRYL